MKKAITIVLALTMLCTNCFAILVPHSGDVNEDGNISIVDVAKTRASIVKILQFTDEESIAADTNRDNLVDIVDVILMRVSIINNHGKPYAFHEDDTSEISTDNTDTQTENTDTETDISTDTNKDTDVSTDTDISSDTNTDISATDTDIQTDTDTNTDTESDTQTDIDTQSNDDTDTEEYERLYYYRSLLRDETLIDVYDTIVLGLQQCQMAIRFNPIEENDIINIYSYLMLDHPELYYVKTSYSYLINNFNQVIGVTPKYDERFDTVSRVNAGYAEIDNEVNPIIEEALKRTNKYAQIMYVYDALKQRFTYEITDDSYDIYGPLKTGSAVCEGYSETFSYILDRMKIQNILVGGVIKNTNVSHRWNMLYLDGKWYHFDITWDDNYNDETIEYSYFGLTTEDMLKSRTIDDVVPIANSNAYNFYYKNQLVLDNLNYDAICAAADRSIRFSTNTIALRFTDDYDFNSFIGDAALKSKLIRRYVGNAGFTYITKQYTDLNIVELTWYVN